MELRLGESVFTDDEVAIIATGGDPEIIELRADPGVVADFRSRHPRLVVAVTGDVPGSTAHDCVAAGADVLAGDAFAGVAAATGAGLVCTDPDAALAAGVRPDGILTDPGLRAPRDHIGALVQAGHTVLVTPAPSAGEATEHDPAELAVTAVYAWLGARVVRTGDVAGVRQVLDMVASVRGTRQPAVSRRALA